MQDFFTHFHFLRPLWLLAIVPALLLCLLLWNKKSQHSQWQQLIPSDLLQHLLDSSVTKTARWPLWGVAFGWVLTCLALSGPTWQKLPQPLHQSQSAVVIVFDLSPSMVAEDIKPSRLIRARYKLTDFLNQRIEGLTALIVYAGEAHVVSPLTDDVDTITNLLTSLSPDMMPLRGSNIEMGIEKAIQLFKDSGLAEGKILVVTDSIDSAAIPALEKSLINKPFKLSILGVGTTEGAPIPIEDGGFAKDRAGNIVIAKLNQSQLISLTNALSGTYSPLRADNKDLELINNKTNVQNLNVNSSNNKTDTKSERQFDSWKDQGHLLALLLLPIIALSFRRGWLLSVACLALFIPEPSYAFGWDDLWLRSDQQGQKSLQNNDAESAIQQFKNPQWRGSAEYRNKDYEAAAESFSQGTNISDLYNHGNALAKAGKLSEAIESYNKALDLFNSSNPDQSAPHLTSSTPKKSNVEFNKELVEKLLKQKQEQKNQEKDGDKSSDQDSQSQNSDGAKEKKEGDSNSEENDPDQKNENSEQTGKSEQNQNKDQQDQAADGNASQDATDEKSAQELADQKLAGEDEKQNEDKDKESSSSGKNQDEEEELSEDKRTNQDTPNKDNNKKKEEKNTKKLSKIDSDKEPNNEQQQALEQWLRQVPDDPSGLLRRKFEYQHRQLRQQYQRGQWAPPENDAAERW
ncbi:MAG: VWA domain-containing protein [Cellvibrionaceae bacterium]